MLQQVKESKLFTKFVSELKTPLHHEKTLIPHRTSYIYCCM